MVLLLLAYSAVTLRGQTTSATVVGTLTDASGARIAGGTVLLKDLATGIEHSATTDANGEYVVPDLKAAHYFVTFSMNGFRPFVMSDIELLVAQRATLDATLQVGEATQVVTVDTVAPMVDTTVPGHEDHASANVSERQRSGSRAWRCAATPAFPHNTRTELRSGIRCAPTT
jgi:Carboxypeptidase regulatory-like domain